MDNVINYSELEQHYDGFSFAIFHYKGKPYTGYFRDFIYSRDFDLLRICPCIEGKVIGIFKEFIADSKKSEYVNDTFVGIGSISDYVLHGFILRTQSFAFYDYNFPIEIISCSQNGERSYFYSIFEQKNKIENKNWQEMREGNLEEKFYENDLDFLPYYNLQNELKEQIVAIDQLPVSINYIAGVDVAYHEDSQKMVGGIVVLDAKTLEVVETALHEMEITFPYIPGLFSFREIPPLLEAYKKLTIKPDLIVCDAQGIAHPKGVGMATHLGIELDIPTIGCAKKRLVGYYDKEVLGTKRGDSQSLIWDSQEVGKALRTQDEINPMFVSIGHKISLKTACEWVLKLCPKYRLPETTRAVDHLVNQVMKERTDFSLFSEDDFPSGSNLPI
jgi:deoxyribonuclease V